jgi:hypothetical protein
MMMILRYLLDLKYHTAAARAATRTSTAAAMPAMNPPLRPPSLPPLAGPDSVAGMMLLSSRMYRYEAHINTYTYTYYSYIIFKKVNLLFGV